ncbi:MAG: putative Ig domain-containing protein [Reichenbachiella sp.]|uniref:putative Ig domain-containing protein n=1 Tax=Reichenbachiella sp. TaxID=2184521 RepID=UPI002966CC47|nr:putative Ig domain-containing protein [Reichenbachiella sp.]MDW3210146.1 putative Ig domain-containing protein [Reichenbachiella sp.]
MKIIYSTGVLLIWVFSLILPNRADAQDISTVLFRDLTMDQQIKGIFSLELASGDYLKEMPDGTLSTEAFDEADEHFYFWIIENITTRTFQLHSAATASSVFSLTSDGTASLTTDFGLESAQLMLRMDPAGPLRTLPLDDSSPEAIGSIITGAISSYAGVADCECYGLSFAGSHRINFHEATFANGTYVGFPFEKSYEKSSDGIITPGTESTNIAVSGEGEQLNFISSQFYVGGFGENDFQLTVAPGSSGTVGFVNYMNQVFTPEVYEYARPEVGIRFEDGKIVLFVFSGDQELPDSAPIDQEVDTDFEANIPIQFGFRDQNTFFARQGDRISSLTTAVPAEQYLNQSITQRARVLVSLSQGSIDMAYTLDNGLINSSNDHGSINGKYFSSTNPYLPYNSGEQLVNSFDWQESRWKVRHAGNQEGEEVFSPYYTYRSDMSSINAKFGDNNEYQGGEDYSSLDGWELLKANLGYNADGTPRNITPDHPYVIMYDRVSAVMRVFVFAKNEGESNQLQVELGVAGKYPNNPQPDDYHPLLWGSLQQFKSFDEIQYGAYTKTTKLYGTDERRWYFYDFIMEYDPCTSFFESSIIININRISKGELSLVGRLQGGEIPAGTPEYNDWVDQDENFLLGVMGTSYDEASNSLGDITMNRLNQFNLMDFSTTLDGHVVGRDITEAEKQQAKLEAESYALQADMDDAEKEAAAKKTIAKGSTAIGAGIAGGIASVFLGPQGGMAVARTVNTIGNGIYDLVEGIDALGNDDILPSRKMAQAKKIYYNSIKDKVKEDDQALSISAPEPRPSVVFGDLALTGEMTTRVNMATEYLATPGGLNADQASEWYLNNRGAAPLYNSPLGKFTMLNQPQFAVAVTRNGDKYYAYLKIKEKPYFAFNDRIGGKITDAIKISINVETADGISPARNAVSSGYTIQFDADQGALPGGIDITNLLDQSMLKTNFDAVAENADFAQELSNWVNVSYEVWSMTFTTLKSRNQQRVIASSSQYFDGSTVFAYQELEGNYTDFALTAESREFANATAAFDAYDFGDHDSFGQNYSISNLQTDFKTVMLDYCTALSGVEPDLNVMPKLGFIGDRSIDELSPLNFTTDVRNDNELDESQIPVFSLDQTSIDKGMTIDGSTGEFSWTPAESHDGIHQVTISVADQEGRNDQEKINITVKEVNEAPILNEVGDQVIDEQSQLTFAVEASDPDNTNQTLTFTLDDTSIASGMSVDPSSGTFDWTPTALQVGQHEVTISVSDGLLEDSEIIAVTVNKTTDSSEEEEGDDENEEDDETILNIEDLDLATVIYPNPATGVINIEIENEYRGALEVQVLNISGRLMKYEEVFKNNRIFHLAIDLEELNPSIYFINLKTEHNNIVKKVILQ